MTPETHARHESADAPRWQRTSFHAVVIGAGPAGSAAAIWLAQAGWHVALVEKDCFPRRKVCGECIAASNLPLLQALGVADTFSARAGPELHEVALLCGQQHIRAALPPAAGTPSPWGRALGRDTLDTLLLEQARRAGATVLQPWAVKDLHGRPGAWRCSLRATDRSAPADASPLQLYTPVVIDAHGAWDTQSIPSDPTPLTSLAQAPRPPRKDSDLLAFKASFTGAQLPGGAIHVLALEGGYGGMVLADGGTSTLACCIRRDRLRALRSAAPGLNAGEVVQAWLQRQCAGVADALRGATRTGPWLACGPLAPGVRLTARDTVFRIGNAAGEAHPILGEGISMALQSAALLCAQLLRQPGMRHAPRPQDLADIQRHYTTDWLHNFSPRLQLAASFAHAAMRPGASRLLMGLLHPWPGLLTQGARWGAKVRPALPPAVLLAQGT
jgi:flavin-dependent dehydrogenase